MSRSILVVGGAGYIGSHMVQSLASAGHHVVVLDDLSTGFADAVHGADLVVGALGDREVLDRLFRQWQIDAVMHFAARIEVAESVRKPLAYYANNVGQTLILLQAMLDHGVKRFIFSSTAATFGNALYTPIDELHPQQPINPYGHSKLMIERVLSDLDHAEGFRSVCLRYFNAAGADPEARIGERHDPEIHLIPLVLQAASGRRKDFSIYGDDYETPDGTCIRDFIHVEDLCSAHLLSLEHLMAGGESRRYNLGNGEGFSVLEVVEAARRVTGKPIPTRIEPRRPGDPPRLVADSRLIRRELSWDPQRNQLSTIIEDAWRWEQSHSWRKARRGAG